MDLREKMAMLRMEQGQPTEHDKELIFGEATTEDTVVKEPVSEAVEAEPPKKRKKLAEVGREKMETLGSSVAEKRLLMQVSQDLKKVIEKLSSQEFANEVADAVVAKIEASVED
ncbi:MAG: hypothetical protein NC218_03755 [Acetobacter sp.]|nr:hypothetical protein [Acetobacter sp.]